MTLVEVEAVEGGQELLGEGADAVPQPVVFGKGVALVGEGLAVVGDRGAAGVEFLSPALQVDQLDEPGLVAIDQPAPFGLGGLGLAVQPGELGGQELTKENLMKHA